MHPGTSQDMAATTARRHHKHILASQILAKQDYIYRQASLDHIKFQINLIRACLDGVRRKQTEPGSIWPQPSKPSRFLRQQHLTKEDWMSFKFLVTINSRCTTVELAFSVDGLLKNVLAQHLPGTLYIFCGNIYKRFEILQNTIIYENTSRNHFKIRWIIWEETRLSFIIYLQ
jgi:hypothetical protein